ncbi:MAG: heparan-alpha-glucosaminide N-acetyltransferase domain-containing protein [Patescibacteria group bacterium]
MINNSDRQIKDWPALSVVKFVCLAVLIFVHAHMALITDSGVVINPFGFFYKTTSSFMFLGLFLFILPIIAGAILRMDLDKEFVQGKLRKDYGLGKIIRVAIFLSLTGFFMNMITFGFGYTFSWNVLQLVGLSFIIIVFLMKKFSVRAVGWLGLVTLLAAGPLRNILGSWDYLYFVGIFIGVNNAYVFWPFFPWFGVVVFGFLTAHYYLKYKDSIKFRASLLVMGAALILIAILRGEISPHLDPNYIWGSSLFQPKIGWVFASLGLFCLLVAIGNIF